MERKDVVLHVIGKEEKNIKLTQFMKMMKVNAYVMSVNAYVMSVNVGNVIGMKRMDMIKNIVNTQDEIEIFSIEEIKSIIFLLGEGAIKEEIVQER